MRWKREESGTKMLTRCLLLFLLTTISACDGVRRPAQRRKDTARSSELYLPAPSAESLQVIAQAMGAAGFEDYTEGRALVKRLIPADSQPDLDVVEHQGVIGKAGVDFPAYPNIPHTGFNCKNVPTGYYADLETDCQVFHICDTSRKISFLCPNGTIFSQSHLICDWWFKVDCASAPALYESSAEYYSNEQKKTQKITQSLSKNSDLQQIGTDTNIRAEPRRTSINIPTATERLLRHRQRLHSEIPSETLKPTSRSYQVLFDNFNPTQRTQATTAFEKRRKNLVQLITNGFGNGPTTAATYTVAPSYRGTSSNVDHNNIREMQIAAETASFANNNNRQFLQDFNSKNFRPYPVYTPNLTPKPGKTKPNPNLTSLYDIRDKKLDQVTQATTTKRPTWSQDSTTKRPTLVPYTKSYSTNILDNRDQYTRPGVSLLKEFINKEKNKTLATTTEKITKSVEATYETENKTAVENQVKIETKNTFESATKIPQTTRKEYSLSTEPSTATSRSDTYSHDTSYLPQTATEAYQERRDRLIRKLNFETPIYGTTSSTAPTIITEKYYGDLPNRPGLIVPPSLTPKTLHSLAIYYATALDNLSTTPAPEEEITETTSHPFDEYQEQNLEDTLPNLFSRQTINKYSHLFSKEKPSAQLLEEIKLDPNITFNELTEDLSVQQSQNPIATSPQIRELAQVFTHALSAYLQDPVQFRKALSEIRPTHPSFGDMITTDDSYNTEPTTTINEDDEEILGFSDDNRLSRPSLHSLRDSKSIKISTDYPTASEQYSTEKIASNETIPDTYQTTTPHTTRSPFRCCGRISASYTSASTANIPNTTPVSFTNTEYSTKNSDTYVTTTENSYTAPNYIGLRNHVPVNSSPYGQNLNNPESKPLSEYIEATNLPTAWGVDASVSTVAPIINAHSNIFESKKIKATTIIPSTTPVYFTETDSVELENEEELQRAHSQSFLSPQDNTLHSRKGKQINTEEIKKPSEELEAPTLPDAETTTIQTTTQPSATTTVKVEDPEFITTASPIPDSIFTSPDSEKTTNLNQWSSTFDSWSSTVIDPITLNDGLSQTNIEEVNHVARQTNSWEANTATTSTPEYIRINEQTVSPSINIEQTTPASKSEDRFGRYLRGPTSTESAQDISTITDTVVEKAKEIMGGMNATTTEKLMNVMKKTKSKTVKRLILLLVQTCDDDHNTTAEASKRALLEALMAVSQKDMDEIAKEELEEIPITTVDYESLTTDVKRSDRRRGKSLNVDASAINSLSNPTTTESVRTTTEVVTEPLPTTLSPRTTHRRGAKKYYTKSTPGEFRVTKAPFIDVPIAEARTAPQGSDLKGASDTRALELLRSLYTIAARWG